jgi:putative transcriptional regulator
MKERDVFSELLEGMTEWREFNAGNQTLRSHSSCLKPFILPARRAKRPRACGRKSRAALTRRPHFLSASSCLLPRCLLLLLLLL